MRDLVRHDSGEQGIVIDEVDEAGVYEDVAGWQGESVDLGLCAQIQRDNDGRLLSDRAPSPHPDHPITHLAKHPNLPLATVSRLKGSGRRRRRARLWHLGLPPTAFFPASDRLGELIS